MALGIASPTMVAVMGLPTQAPCPDKVKLGAVLTVCSTKVRASLSQPSFGMWVARA